MFYSCRSCCNGRIPLSPVRIKFYLKQVHIEIVLDMHACNVVLNIYIYTRIYQNLVVYGNNYVIRPAYFCIFRHMYNCYFYCRYQVDHQFEKKFVYRELNKCFCAFNPHRNQEHIAPIATGNWGCGAFNGNLVIFIFCSSY